MPAVDPKMMSSLKDLTDDYSLAKRAKQSSSKYYFDPPAAKTIPASKKTPISAGTSRANKEKGYQNPFQSQHFNSSRDIRGAASGSGYPLKRHEEMVNTSSVEEAANAEEPASPLSQNIRRQPSQREDSDTSAHSEMKSKQH